MQLKIRLDLTNERVRQQLMNGLDSWVQLDLLSEQQVKEIATILSQPLPEQTAAAVDERSPIPIGQSAEVATVGASASTDLSDMGASVVIAQKTNWMSQAIAALIEEISVIWLLFLGVFLVIVSSGVLAASQWNSFSAVGQYGILFAYTLAFWAASLWAQKRENLQSTGRMLALTTMLLIPVNFWVMDRFGVLGSGLGIGIAFVAAIALTIFPLGLSAELMPRRINRINLIGLSWLHWGWGWAVWPVIATYLGTVGTAANLTAQDRGQRLTSAGSAAESTGGLAFDVLTVALSILILLVRSLWVAQVPPQQLGLAAGICGWLLVWLTRKKDSRIVWERSGFGLLLLGWVVSVGQSPPLQAIALSLLALSLLWMRLKQTWDRAYLLAALGVGLQTYGLIWAVVPMTLRDRLLAWLSEWFQVGTVERVNWAGIGLFPYLIGMLLFAAYLRRAQQTALGSISNRLALVLGFVLALMSSGNPFTAAVNLSLATLTLTVVLRRRRLKPDELVTLTHGVGLLCTVSWIHYVAPELSSANWARVALGGAIAEFIGHLFLRRPHLQFNTWWAGLGLSAISYALLLDSQSVQPNWLWLLVPVALTVVANHQWALYPQKTVGVVMGALALQLPWLSSWPIAIASFAVATACMGLNSRIWRSRYPAFFTVGTGLLLASSTVWYSLIRTMDNSAGQMLIFWVIAIWSLWLIQRGLLRRSHQMAFLYIQATRRWAGLLLVLYLLWATYLAVVTTFVDLESYSNYALAATLILIAALAEYIRQRPMNWRYWSLAWATQSALVVGLTLQGVSLGNIGIATLALAFAVQIAADVWVIKRPPYRMSWHGIPLAIAAIGLGLGHLVFQADTGCFTLATGILLLGVGRRRSEETNTFRFEVLSYLGLAALSIGAYELLFYQLSQASGGRPGDGITLLAGLALGFAALYRAFRRWAAPYLRVSPRALTIAGHSHWVLGSVLCILAAQAGLSQPQGIAMWTLCALLLSSYAISVGNRRWTPAPLVFDHATWTWFGLIGALVTIAYDRYLWFPDRAGLLTWGGVIACAIGAALYYLPWEKLGWSEPWRLVGLWLPMLTLSITSGAVQTQGLLLVAAFYAWMAWQIVQVRLSYLSVLLLDYALLNYLAGQGWLTSTVFGLVIGLSVLYVAQVEPYFRASAQASAVRQQRHWIRVLASGLVGLTALYQTEISEPFLAFAAIALALGILFIFAGLILKVRAFLYAGTATFIAQILRALWLFISANSLLLWAVGIVLGLLFIWVAATFESRRSQLGTQLSAWTSTLATWD